MNLTTDGSIRCIARNNGMECEMKVRSDQGNVFFVHAYFSLDGVQMTVADHSILEQEMPVHIFEQYTAPHQALNSDFASCFEALANVAEYVMGEQ